MDQRNYIVSEVNKRSGSVFDPAIVKVFNTVSKSDSFWNDIKYKSFDSLLNKNLSELKLIEYNYENLKQISIIFSRIVDFRSHYTAAHSIGVGIVSKKLAEISNLIKKDCQSLEIAGYLHDIGKVAINSKILDKKGSLSNSEYEHVKEHVYFTNLFLLEIKSFSEIALLASAHHERHDGNGYPYHYKNNDFTKK
ncbi:MAG: HD domain-containing protein [Bacillota bacterium]|nr:HD domain-containing protein [Bacillota bacterium]